MVSGPGRVSQRGFSLSQRQTKPVDKKPHQGRPDTSATHITPLRRLPSHRLAGHGPAGRWGACQAGPWSCKALGSQAGFVPAPPRLAPPRPAPPRAAPRPPRPHARPHPQAKTLMHGLWAWALLSKGLSFSQRQTKPVDEKHDFRKSHVPAVCKM